MIDYKDFGKRIRVLRRAQRITQEELAEKKRHFPLFHGAH